MDLSISLDDARAREPTVVGAKAAGLALARAGGLPVLPGWIIPTHLAAPATAAGAAALRRTGAPSATRAVHAVPVGEPLLRDLERIARRLGRDAIVRSSATQEDDSVWAGAFASYVEVSGADLAAAVRGCWASAFTRDALARCRALGVDPRALRMAVLIQPWTPFEAGGTARVNGAGQVAVSAAPGWPGALVAGRVGGWDLVVSRHNEVDAGGSSGASVDVRLVRAVASLARSARETTGHPVIEWGARGGELALLQVRSTGVRRTGGPDQAPAGRRAVPRPRLGARGHLAERLAVLAARFGGPLGDRLVLPWALAADPLPGVSATAEGDPSAAVAEARELSLRLTAVAWGLPPEAAGAAASRAIRLVLGPNPEEGLVPLARLRPVDPSEASRLLAVLESVGRGLAANGALGSPDLVWGLTLAQLQSTIGPSPDGPPWRSGPGRWEPFIFSVVAERGDRQAGRGGTPGIGAGPLHRPGDQRAGRIPPSRAVLAVATPLPQVAPLLWNAAGLVVAAGSSGAHLLDVARSLGVPTVLGVDLQGSAAGTLVAVDGYRGRVSTLAAARGAAGTMGA